MMKRTLHLNQKLQLTIFTKVFSPSDIDKTFQLHNTVYFKPMFKIIIFFASFHTVPLDGSISFGTLPKSCQF